MAKQTIMYLLALTSLAPSIWAAPVLGREECICQPISAEVFSNSSIASCKVIAEQIQRWRAISFHSPYLADVFVDAERQLQVSKTGGHLVQRRHAHQVDNVQHDNQAPKGAFDRAVRNIFRQWKRPVHHPVIVSRHVRALKAQVISRVVKRVQATKSQEDYKDQSPGRVVEEHSNAKFLEPPQRYRILCRSRNAPEVSSFTGRPELMLLGSLIIVIIWMLVFDMIVIAWRSFRWISERDSTTEGTIALDGNEKTIYAFQTEEEDTDAAVIPAISDL